jgi:cobalt-zinc-cadmium efflux system membrane fusion protein
LVKLARSGMLALELQATPAQSLSIATGATVSVSGCAKPGRVRGLGTLVRGGNQAVTVHVDMPATPVGSACLRPNQAVTAEVTAGASDGNTHASNVGVSVPTRALFQHGGADHVFVQEGDAFRAAPVQVLSRQGEHAQLSSGVNSGASVVTQGISTLKAAWLGMGEDTAGKP